VIVVTVPAAPTPPAPPAAGSIDFAWKVGRIQIGHFIGSLINFLLVAFAIFVIVVKMLGNVVKRITPVSPTEPTTKECPRCLSNIPHRATKCPFCTADLDPPAATVPDAVA
jgi:large conductance mechanosensitive channel